MAKATSAGEIRALFLDYFAEKGHEKVASSPIIPKDDPTLLFTNAGMVQFKRAFLGQEQRETPRATTSQKCLRVGGKHNDLENVGRTARHHTFFEMLGNFSFGDYFKEDAIRFAWEFLTERLALPKDKLYATIYKDDDEAGALWKKIAHLPDERIFRLGDKDNFWSMGDTGPCGPCSEILIDQGEALACGPDCGIGVCECDRFLEIWNLVFMQFNQDETGARSPLPRPSIDTGMGLERIAAVCQGVFSNFDTDIFQRIIGYTVNLSEVAFRTDPEQDTAHRVIADHARAVAFMVADGILPSNEGRGYVMRRLIRRAFRFGRLLNLREPFIYKVAAGVEEIMGEAFPELTEHKSFTSRVIREEEERFARTLDKGLEILEEELATLKAEGRTEVPGATAFKLYDTYGFPIDIVNDVAEKQGFTVDEAGYNSHMAEQKKRAKSAWKGSGEVDLSTVFSTLTEAGVTSVFTGYDHLTGESAVTQLLNASAETVTSLTMGEEGFLVAVRTPFYGESGGQMGDTGTVTGPGGAAEVTQTLKPATSLTVQAVRVTSGSLKVGETVTLAVKEGERLATARNHTTTHLLHAALRKVLGEHVKQAGSLVGPERLRFDFNHFSAMTAEEIAAVEADVNRAVLANIPLCVEQMAYDAAVERGAMALFGEKYTDEVRVVEIPGASVELCGGTHLTATGQAGPFLVLSETGVAAGVRRIEGATGQNALKVIAEARKETADVAALLKTKPGELAPRVAELQKELKAARKECESLAAKAALAGNAGSGSIMDSVEEIGGVKVLAAQVAAPNVKALREIMDDIRSKLASGIAFIVAPPAPDDEKGKVNCILSVSKDLHDRFTAPALIKDVAAKIDGSGGGRPDQAQAGGTNPDGIADAITTLKELVKG